MFRLNLVSRVCGLAGLLASPLLPAQTSPVPKPAPVEDRAPIVTSPLLQQQQRTSAAYREVQQTAFEAKLAEQEVLNTQDAFKAARERAEMLKADLEKAVKARDAAKAREAAARRRYDEALRADAR